LPVELPVPTWPLGVMILKNRTISPVAQLFLDCAQEVVKPLQHRHNGAAGSETTRNDRRRGI
jgi:hypothetical protein